MSACFRVDRTRVSKPHQYFVVIMVVIILLSLLQISYTTKF